MSPAKICPQKSVTKGEEVQEGVVEEVPDVIFREAWARKSARVKQQSPFGHLPGWKLVPVIVKSEDDLRQEQLAYQVSGH